MFHLSLHQSLPLMGWRILPWLIQFRSLRFYLKTITPQGMYLKKKPSLYHICGHLI